LVANRITGIYAIINGTTNYILTRMAREGIDFTEALRQARHLGYAEADPTNDIDGHDARFKLAILGSLAFQTTLSPDEIYSEGIRRTSSRDFQYARELGFTIKLLAIAQLTGDEIEARVHPVLIPEDRLLAKIDGVYNGILVEADQAGQVLFYGEGAGAKPTASAVLADVMAAARDIVTGTSGHHSTTPTTERRVIPISEVVCSYYLRMTIVDSFGVLAQIARVLAQHEISILSVIQKTTSSRHKDAEIVLMTHAAVGEAMHQALAEIDKLDVVKEVSNFIRVLE
jgi:homoserine dehydrogenase